jgi:hypothetical protein
MWYLIGLRRNKHGKENKCMGNSGRKQATWKT